MERKGGNNVEQIKLLLHWLEEVKGKKGRCRECGGGERRKERRRRREEKWRGRKERGGRRDDRGGMR